MTSQDALALIAEIKKLNLKLNDWEKGFLGNILIHRKISNKQAKILCDMYAKFTGDGNFQRRQYI